MLAWRSLDHGQGVAGESLELARHRYVILSEDLIGQVLDSISVEGTPLPACH